MKTCLLIGRSNAIGGSEKAINTLKDHLTSTEWKIETTCIAHSSEGSRILGGKNLLRLSRIFFTRYNLIHSHLFIPGIFIFLKRVFDSSFVWIHTVHYGGYEGQSFSSLKRLIDKYLVFRFADRLIAVSDSVETWLSKDNSLICKTQKIYNCVEMPDDTDNESPVNVNFFNGITLGTTAMLRFEKGLDEMIRSISILKSRNFKIKLLIAGDGPEKEKLRQLIKKLDLENEVELLGYQKNIHKFLCGIDLFVSASKIESFGIGLVEALLHAKPVVAPRVGEIAKILQEGEFGKLVENRSSIHFSELLANSIAEVIRDLKKYQERAEKAQLFFRDKFSRSQNIAEHKALYNKLLSPAICMICPIVTHATGGIQKQILLQSRALAQKGYQVFLLQKRDPLLHEKCRDWKHAEFLETPTLYGTYWSKFNIASRIESLLFILFGFLKIFEKRRNLQVLHAHQLYSPALTGILAKKLLGIPLVVKVTASGKFGELNELEHLPMLSLRKYLFKSIDSLIILSEEMYAEMKILGFEDRRMHLIPNSVEISGPLTRAAKVVEDLELSTRTLKILYTGRISVEKSLGTLIQAADIVARTGFQLELNFVGGVHGGRDDSVYLQELCKLTSNNLRVIFHGNQKDITSFYQDADIFVLPSVSEGMSNSLLEAMSAGLPVIVSDIPANLFVVTSDQEGLSFKVEDADDLALKLIRLGSSSEGPGLRAKLGQNARIKMQNQFSVPFIASKLDNLYQSLVNAQQGDIR